MKIDSHFLNNCGGYYQRQHGSIKYLYKEEIDLIVGRQGQQLDHVCGLVFACGLCSSVK